MSNVLEARSATFKIDIGIDRDHREPLAEKLGDALASSYMLYLKTQGFHWNVAGPLFFSLHKLTEMQYEDLAEAIDEIAERIRSIGFPAPASLTAYADRSVVKEEPGVPTAEEMVQQLVDDNEAVTRQMREMVELAEKADDVKTADLLTGRLGQHEENAWMLRALLA